MVDLPSLACWGRKRYLVLLLQNIPMTINVRVSLDVSHHFFDLESGVKVWWVLRSLCPLPNHPAGSLCEVLSARDLNSSPDANSLDPECNRPHTHGHFLIWCVYFFLKVLLLFSLAILRTFRKTGEISSLRIFNHYLLKTQTLSCTQLQPNDITGTTASHKW